MRKKKNMYPHPVLPPCGDIRSLSGLLLHSFAIVLPRREFSVSSLIMWRKSILRWRILRLRVSWLSEEWLCLWSAVYPAVLRWSGCLRPVSWHGSLWRMLSVWRWSSCLSVRFLCMRSIFLFSLCPLCFRQSLHSVWKVWVPIRRKLPLISLWE